jgi:hypothetical protein
VIWNEKMEIILKVIDVFWKLKKVNNIFLFFFSFSKNNNKISTYKIINNNLKNKKKL